MSSKACVRMVDLEDRSVRMRFDGADEAEMREWARLLGATIEISFVEGMIRERRRVLDLIERHIDNDETGSMGGEEALSDLSEAIRNAEHLASGVR